MIVKGLLWLHNLFSILCDVSSFFLLMVFEMFFLAESAPRKVKSLHALFALATEVLRLFGDFADQVGRESGWTSRFCASLLWKFEIHVTLLYCMTSIIYNIWIYMIYVYTYIQYIYIHTLLWYVYNYIWTLLWYIYIYTYIYIYCAILLVRSFRENCEKMRRDAAWIIRKQSHWVIAEWWFVKGNHLSKTLFQVSESF